MELGLAGKIEGMLKELLAGPGAMRATLKNISQLIDENLRGDDSMLEKRRFRIPLRLTLLTVSLSIEACMELRYTRDEPVVTSEDTASVLRQFPQVEITEEDQAMMQDFFQCAAVGELLESGGR